MSRMATMNIHDRGDGVISWNQVRQRILALADDGPYEPDAPARIPRARPSLARRVSMDGEAQTWPERVPESFGAPSGQYEERSKFPASFIMSAATAMLKSIKRNSRLRGDVAQIGPDSGNQGDALLRPDCLGFALRVAGDEW